MNTNFDEDDGYEEEYVGRSNRLYTAWEVDAIRNLGWTGFLTAEPTLSTAEIQVRYGVDGQWLINQCREGLFAPAVALGDCAYWRQDEIEELMEIHNTQETPERQIRLRMLVRELVHTRPFVPYDLEDVENMGDKLSKASRDLLL